MSKVKNTIPVYNIRSLKSDQYAAGKLVAEPFASYLDVHPNLHTPHRHTFYHIVYFTKGKGYHTIDFERFDVRAGQVYFMTPGQVHGWSFSGPVDGYIINFSKELFDASLSDSAYLDRFSFFRGIAADSVLQLRGGDATFVRGLFEKIVGETREDLPFAIDAIMADLTLLFITVQRSISSGSEAGRSPRDNATMNSFRSLIDQHYEDRRMPKDYAPLLRITPNHLNALCKELLGKPAGELIRDRVLLESKRLLINVDISIGEIAARLSFTDNAHFTRFFKKATDHTPEDFRKTHTSDHKN